MHKEIRRVTKEQSELLENFTDPIEFFFLYIKAYEMQAYCSTKIFWEDIPYASKFQIEFLGIVLDKSLNGPLDDPILYELSSHLIDFSYLSFHDKLFLSCSLTVLAKAFKIVLSRVENMLVTFNYSYVHLLYTYSQAPIDIYSILVEDAYKALRRCSLERLIRLTIDIKNINERIAEAMPSPLLRLFSKYCQAEVIGPLMSQCGNASSCFVGVSRVPEYSEDEVLRRAAAKYLESQESDFIERGYLTTIKLTDTLSKDRRYEPLSRLLKEGAREMLDKKTSEDECVR